MMRGHILDDARDIYWMMPGAYSFLLFRMWVHGYMLTNVHPSVQMCVCKLHIRT